MSWLCAKGPFHGWMWCTQAAHQPCMWTSTISCFAAIRPTEHMEDESPTFLKTLHMQDFALVKEQIVELEPGLNVITGESGAGKSVLVQAFGQLLGEPTLDNCIRQPATTAAVEGCFQLSNITSAYLTRKFANLGLPRKAVTASDGGNMSRMMIRREISQTPNGLRCRCSVNGTATSLRILREIGNLLVDVNGQNSSQALKESGMQLDLLDKIAGTRAKASKFASMLTRMHGLEKQIRELLALGDEQERERLQELCDRAGERAVSMENIIPSLVHAFGGILNLQEGEERLLRKELKKMEFRRGAIEQCNLISTSLSGDGSGGGIVDALQGVMSQMRELSRREEANMGDDEENEDGEGVSILEDAMNSLAAATSEVYKAEEVLEDYTEHCRFDEFEYEEVGKRLQKIEVLLRDFECHTCEDLLELVEDAARRLDTWYQMKGKQAEWGVELKNLKDDIVHEGCELSRMRRSSAGRLRSAVEKCLQQLAMASSRFDIRISWEKAYSDAAGLMVPEDFAGEVGEHGGEIFRPTRAGFDNVEFLLAAGPQEPLRPLNAVASGGESSRIMLALKSAPVAMTEQDGQEDGNLPENHRMEGSVASQKEHEDLLLHQGAPILVLDELDSGVGGRLGETVGKMLKILPNSSATSTAQLLCVSHLPQVAAYASHHIKVQKSVGMEGRMESRFRVLSNPGDRIEEVSEMLGVEKSAAIKLLCNAQGWEKEEVESESEQILLSGTSQYEEKSMLDIKESA